MNAKFKIRLRNASVGLLVFVVAMALWLPCLHIFFSKPLSDFYPEKGISPKARQLAARHLQLWTEPALRQTELKKMRGSNAEWDFMGRSFLVWSLVNMGMREPQMKQQYLPVIDQIIQETVRIEQHDGIYAFLMSYAKDRPYVVKPARSLFIDGEIALMMAARRMLQEQPVLVIRSEMQLFCMRAGSAPFGKGLSTHESSFRIAGPRLEGRRIFAHRFRSASTYYRVAFFRFGNPGIT